MKLREGYIEDLRLRSVAEVVVDPKNKLAKVASKFLQGVRNKDLIDPKPPYDPKSKEDKKRLRIEWVRVSLLKISLDQGMLILLILKNMELEIIEEEEGNQLEKQPPE